VLRNGNVRVGVMNMSRFRRKLSTALCLSVIAAAVVAQAQSPATPFEPQVGQEGKDVVWIPTPSAVVDEMLDMARLTPQDYLIDLGSGDGRTVIAAAKRGARALGIEYNGEMVTLAQRRAAAENVGARAAFTQADLFETDLSQATVITMFLLPDLNLMLRPRILALKPGTRVVSNTFTMGNWLADETRTVAGCSRWCTALMWIVPATVEGTWHSTAGGLEIKQEYQLISGTLASGQGPVTMTNGILRGDRLSFSAAGSRYTGAITGNVIKGRVTSGDSVTPWNAERVVP
jgi:precorrin-6B methylase 2